MKFTTNASLIVLALIFICAGGSSAYAAGPAFTKNLTLGSRGAEVSALQQLLIDGNFLKIVAPTAYFGPITKKALGAWQASLNISPAVGYFGPISRAKANKVVVEVKTSIALATTTNPVPAIIIPSVGTIGTINTNIKDGSPVRLTIPKINVDAGFQYTGVTAEGAMEIPTNIVDIGWFTGSPRPGEKGASVITGHVAQIRGGVLVKAGVFNDLRELRPGDKLYVLNDKGESITFVVREMRNYDPADNATDVFAARDDGAHLNIITCEGTWDPKKLSYSQRLVVFTDAVK